MTLTDITDTLIARHFDAKVLARGKDYVENGAVENAVLRGEMLTTEVEGSEEQPYQVTITLGADDIADAACDCPYGSEWGGWCKHIAATLLVCAHSPEEVTVGLPLGDLLAALNRAALEGILLKLARTEPGISEVIAGEAESWIKAPERTKD